MASHSAYVQQSRLLGFALVRVVLCDGTALLHVREVSWIWGPVLPHSLAKTPASIIVAAGAMVFVSAAMVGFTQRVQGTL